MSCLFNKKELNHFYIFIFEGLESKTRYLQENKIWVPTKRKIVGTDQKKNCGYRVPTKFQFMPTSGCKSQSLPEDDAVFSDLKMTPLLSILIVFFRKNYGIEQKF